MRRFELHRDEDETGISGTGIVASGVCWPDGHIALRWLTEHASTAIYTSIETVEAIHGHGGRTRVVWLDGSPRRNDMRDWTIVPMCSHCQGGPLGERGDWCMDCGANGTIVYLPKWARDDIHRHDKHRLASAHHDMAELQVLRSRLPVPDEVKAHRREHHPDVGLPPFWSVHLHGSSVTFPADEFTEEEARRAGANRLSWLPRDPA